MNGCDKQGRRYATVADTVPGSVLISLDGVALRVSAEAIYAHEMGLCVGDPVRHQGGTYLGRVKAIIDSKAWVSWSYGVEAVCDLPDLVRAPL